MANFPLPKGYQRMGAFPLDATTVFTTLAELETYAASPIAYAGQVCSITDGGVYKVTPTGTVIEVGSNASLDYGVF